MKGYRADELASDLGNLLRWISDDQIDEMADLIIKNNGRDRIEILNKLNRRINEKLP